MSLNLKDYIDSFIIVTIDTDDCLTQGTNERKVNCGRVYSAYTLKPVLSGRNWLTRIDASVFV